jgi:hypothetical protein
MAAKTAAETTPPPAPLVDAIPGYAGTHQDFIPEGDPIVPKSTGKYGDPWPYHEDEYDTYPDSDDGNASPPNIKAAEESQAAAEDVLGPFTGPVAKGHEEPHKAPARAQAGAKTKK